MTLSHSLLARLTTLGVAALGIVLVATPLASAQMPVFRLPPTSRGFQTTMAQQAYYRTVEQVASAVQQPPVPANDVVVTEPRYVTIIGPNGGSRTFVIEGTITVVPHRQVVAHYGANR